MASLDTVAYPPFDLTDKSTLAQRWKKYISRLENYMLAIGVEQAPRKKAILLHFAGPDVMDIFENLPEPVPVRDEAGNVAANQPDEYAKCKTQLTTYFNPQENVTFNIYQFRQLRQESEPIEQFVANLRQKAALCNFHDVDAEIKSQLILGCKDSNLRRKALENHGLTLEQLITKGKASESVALQLKEIEEPEVVRHVKKARARPQFKENHHPHHRQGRQQDKRMVNQQQGRHVSNRQPSHQPRRESSSNSTCGLCGGSYPHPRGPTSCPAYGKRCAKCGKRGHFAKVCRSEPNQPRRPPMSANRAYAYYNTAEESREDRYAGANREEPPEYVFALTTVAAINDSPSAVIEVACEPLKMVIDTGANVNVIDQSAFQKLPSDIELSTSSTSIRPYNAPPLNVLGQFNTTLQFKDKCITDTVYVVAGSCGNLLCRRAAVALGLVTIHVNNVTQSASSHPHNILDEYPSLFCGTGLLKDYQVHLNIDKNVPPVANLHRRIPVNLRDKVAAKLKDLEDNDIIEAVEDAPTPWVSPLVIVPKTNDIRICVDMRGPNKAIQRTRHVLPTFEEVISDLSKSKVFSKLDLAQGYHQLLLDEESRHITTFQTHLGLRRYKRLNFGISCASEIFQEAIRQTIQHIPHVMNVSDDILIHTPDMATHVSVLRQVLDCLSRRGLTLNRDKCLLFKQNLMYLGHKISSSGISPDPEKVAAVKQMAPPTNVAGVRSFMGLVTFCARFIPRIADLSRPLRELTLKDAPWEWSKRHQDAFDGIKDALSCDRVLSFYDPARETRLLVDASPTGVASILTQHQGGKTYVIAYASRALSPTEQRYSQLEREALAILYGCEKFQLYLLGSRFTIITDHKPLIPIFMNPRVQPSARVERWMLKLQAFNFALQFEPGKTNPADFMSRCPVALPARETNTEYINFVINSHLPKAITYEDMACASAQDPIIRQLVQAIETNHWPKISHLEQFRNIRDELSTQDGIVLRNQRIVVPEKLQLKLIDLAHECHQGLVKTKAMMRTKVWFPGMDKMIEQKISGCIPCQATSNLPPPPAVKMKDLPDGPWHSVSVDFYGPVGSEYLLVLIDDYTRYPVVEVVTSTSASSTIPKLHQIFATFGIPRTLNSDNGPPFSSSEFLRFANYCGFRHHRVTPRWPRANGEAERFMRNIKKVIQTAKIEGCNWKQSLHTYLAQYRGTPHMSTMISPHKALFGREPFMKIPDLTCRPSQLDRELQANDARARSRMETQANKRPHRHQALSIGDQVLIRNDKTGKFIPTFNPMPGTVIEVRGTQVTVKRDGKIYKRNESFLKKLVPTFPPRSPVRVRSPNAPVKTTRMSPIPLWRPLQRDIPVIPVELNNRDIPVVPDDIQNRPRRRRQAPQRFNDFVM